MTKPEKPDLSASGLAERLNAVWGRFGEIKPDVVHDRLQKEAGYGGSYESVRTKVRGKGEPSRISADLVAATAMAYGVSSRWLLTGLGNMDDPEPESATFRSGVLFALGEVEDFVRKQRGRFGGAPPGEGSVRLDITPPTAGGPPRPEGDEG